MAASLPKIFQEARISFASWYIMDMSQSFTPVDTAVIQRARRKRRDVIVLREDAEWLREYSTSPKDMVRRMAARGALIKLGAGRYAIPIIGSASPDYKAWQPMLHARLAPLGDYYLAGFSALAEHRLTDLSETRAFVIVGFHNSGIDSGRVDVAGRLLSSAATRRAVFVDKLGIETVRLSRTETYRRSDANRTLVDCLWHPELCGASETWITAWGRAARGVLNPETVCRYALALGPSVACRVGFMLDQLGHGEPAKRMLGGAVRSDRNAPLVARQPKTDTAEIDPTWHVALNVSLERVQGWLSYGK
jgi:predicted transcriptional regulator of viral defense system